MKPQMALGVHGTGLAKSTPALYRAPSLLALYRAGLLLIVAMAPLGAWQNLLFAGFTVPKILVPVIFLSMLASHLPRMRIHPHTGALVIFVFMTAPSLMRSDSFLPVFASFLGYVMLFQLTRNCLHSPRHLRRLIGSYFIGIFSIAVCASLALMGYDIGDAIGRPMVQVWLGLPQLFGTEENANAFATLFVPAIPAALYFLLTARGKGLRVFYLASLVLLVVVASITGGRSAFMGALLACATMILARHQLSVARAMLAVAGLAASALLILSAHEIAADVLIGNSLAEPGLLRDKEMSAGYRVDALQPLFAALLANPLIGIGYGNTYYWTQGSVFGQRVGSHNIFLGIGIEYGAIALLAFVIGLGLAIAAMIRAIKLESGPADRVLPAWFLGSLLGLLVHGMFHEIYVNFLLWFLLACGEATRRAANSGVAQIVKNVGGHPGSGS